MNFILYFAVGGVVGWLAAVIVKGESYGIVADIVIGVLGGIIGGWLIGQLGTGGGLLASIIAPLAGAIILICILRAIKTKTA